MLQGARLTTWELAEAGIKHRLCVDSAAAAAIAGGRVDCVIVGADRVAANGDTANKVGTYGLALAAKRHGIPFIVVAPESTIDRTTPQRSPRRGRRDGAAPGHLKRQSGTGDYVGNSGGNAFGMTDILPARSASSQVSSQPNRGQSQNPTC